MVKIKQIRENFDFSFFFKCYKYIFDIGPHIQLVGSEGKCLICHRFLI